MGNRSNSLHASLNITLLLRDIAVVGVVGVATSWQRRTR
jgi:hypothetical protein